MDANGRRETKKQREWEIAKDDAQVQGNNRAQTRAGALNPRKCGVHVPRKAKRTPFMRIGDGASFFFFCFLFFSFLFCCHYSSSPGYSPPYPPPSSRGTSGGV